jgi:signal transduction histidine kinase
MPMTDNAFGRRENDPVRRLAVLGSLAAVAVWAAARTPDFLGQVSVPCASGPCLVFERPGPDVVAVLASLGLGARAWALGIVALAWVGLLVGVVVAGLLACRLARSTIAQVLAVLAVLTGLTPFATDLRPWLLAAGAALVPVVAGLFPTGTWVPATMRRTWPLVAVLLAGNRLGEALLGPWFAASSLRAVMVGGGAVTMVGIQVYRYARVSDAQARAQTRGPLVGMLLVALAAAGASLVGADGPSAAEQVTLVLLDYVGTAVTLVMLCVALLRYRLFEVDLLVRRSVLFLTVFGGLGLAYAAVVTVAGVLAARTPVERLRPLAVVLVAVVAGVVALALLRRARARLYGFGTRQGAAAVALARSLDTGAVGGPSLPATIAAALAVPYAAVRDGDGRLIGEHHRAVPSREPSPHRLIEIPVTATSALAPGAEVLGRVMLRLPWGQTRLSRRDERVLDEILPFVAVTLRSQAEARWLREARAAAAESREDERRRLRRDLHDGVGPLLAAQLLAIDSLRLERRPYASAELLRQLESATTEALAETRRIARDLRPDALVAVGLKSAVEGEALRFSGAGLPVTVVWSLGECAVPDAVEVAVLRVVQESLSNAAQYAGATRCDVVVAGTEAGVEVSVTDDGCGRDGRPDGLGTASMRERVQALGGVFAVGGGPEGRGTQVRALLPR